MTLSAPDFGARLASVARGLLAEPEVEATLQRSVELTLAHLRSADFVSVSLISGRQRVTTPASTHEWSTRADHLQYENDEGPCLDAIREQEVVLVDDLALDGADRYPRWAQAVVEQTGIRSSLSCRLFTHREELGAVNIYSARPQAFAPADQGEAQVLAAQVALALSAARQLQGMKVGMDGRTVIGQAQGILMERYKIPAERAFELLSRVSQDTNIRLRDVAARLVDTGETPSSPERGKH